MPPNVHNGAGLQFSLSRLGTTQYQSGVVRNPLNISRLRFSNCFRISVSHLRNHTDQVSLLHLAFLRTDALPRPLSESCRATQPLSTQQPENTTAIYSEPP